MSGTKELVEGNRLGLQQVLLRRLLFCFAALALFLLLRAFLFPSPLLHLRRTGCSRLLRLGLRLRPLGLRRRIHACLQALVPGGRVVRPPPKPHGTVAGAAAVEPPAGPLIDDPGEAETALLYAKDRHEKGGAFALHALSKETAAGLELAKAACIPVGL